MRIEPSASDRIREFGVFWMGLGNRRQLHSVRAAARAEAPGPCGNHRGLVLRAAAIMIWVWCEISRWSLRAAESTRRYSALSGPLSDCCARGATQFATLSGAGFSSKPG